MKSSLAIFLSSAVMLVLSACLSGALALPPLSIPAKGLVAQITVNGHDVLPLKTISEPATISQIIDNLNSLNGPMEVPSLSTYPTPQLTVNFHTASGLGLSLFMGPGWFGGGDGGTVRLRSISTAAQAQLLALLGLSDYNFRK